MTQQNKDNLENGNNLIHGIKKIAIAAVFIIVAVVVTFIFVSNIKTREWDAKYAQFRDSAQLVVTQYADSVNKIIAVRDIETDSIKTVAENKTKRINELTTTNTSLRNRNRTIEDSLRSSIPEDSVTKPLYAFIDTLNFEIDTLHIAIESLNSRDIDRLATIANLELDKNDLITTNIKLSNTILNMPPPTKSKFIEINIPNKFGIIVGILVGGYIGYQAGK